MASYGPSKAANLEALAPSLTWQIFKVVIYAILLGVPRNYAHRLMKADWVQVRGSDTLFEHSPDVLVGNCSGRAGTDGLTNNAHLTGFSKA
jgi:hypothetical protein